MHFLRHTWWNFYLDPFELSHVSIRWRVESVWEEELGRRLCGTIRRSQSSWQATAVWRLALSDLGRKVESGVWNLLTIMSAWAPTRN